MSFKKIVTLEQFILQQERQIHDSTGQFTSLLNAIALAGKIIQREASKAGLVDLLGLTGNTNVQGEEVKKLDVYSNDVLKEVFASSSVVCAVASEEDENCTIFSESKGSEYIVLFDPLDGSSNTDINASIGTIFSIHKRVSTTEYACESDLLRAGKDQLAAGYIHYGPGTMIVYSTGNGVNGFTLDPSIGEFLLSHPNMQIPKKGNIYSINEGNYEKWSGEVKKYIQHVKSTTGKKPYSSRYIGTLVADFHRTLLKGGIYLYPSDDQNTNGKLRLLYECAPLAFLCEQAGGKASTGSQSILDITPTQLHQRTPFIVGSKENVEEVEQFLNA